MKIGIYYNETVRLWFARQKEWGGLGRLFGSGRTEEEAIEDFKKKLKEGPKPTYSNPKIIKIDV